MNIVRVESEYPYVPATLLARAEGFQESPEYERLNDVERTLPGVVAAAFTKFLVRNQQAILREVLGNRPSMRLQAILDGAYEALELLSKSRDPKVRTLVQDEIFKNIRASDDLWIAFERSLRPVTSTLLKEWRRREA